VTLQSSTDCGNIREKLKQLKDNKESQPLMRWSGLTTLIICADHESMVTGDKTVVSVDPGHGRN
jgi:hypothetical protein